MQKIIDYIEKSCSGLKDDQVTYYYKKKLLDGMSQRADEMIHAGLKDEKVILDLIADEFGDIEKGFGQFLKDRKKQQRGKFMKVAFPVGGLLFLILIFIAYFTVSSLTSAWDKTWLIIVGGIFAMIIFYFSFAINKLCHMRRVFHPIARVLIIGCVMLFMVFAFLFQIMMLPDEFTSWPTLPAGVALSFVADLIFAYATKQKFRTISFFVYMPVIATMIYIILAAYGIISWITGWPVILIGLVVDLLYIFSIVMSNMKYFMYSKEAE
ncbi:MAG: hypothetical protein J6Q79_01800 [Clostridia bacterium]|nr:hypothetical protein [Clostridia bacterium]